MPLITWTEKYSVGVASIDGQHKKLVDLINELHEAMSKGKSKEVAAKIISSLVSYTKEHFTYEENVLQKAGYVGIMGQKTQHMGFVKKINDFQNDFNSGKVAVSIEILTFLKQWLLDHIMVSDKAYSSFLMSKNVK